MSKLFSVLFVVTVFCYGVEQSVNDVVQLPVTTSSALPVEVPTVQSVAQVVGMDISNINLIKKGSCAIYLDASAATDAEKEAAYQAIENAIANFEGRVPDSIGINVGISNIELVEEVAAGFPDINQEPGEDRVVAVKDIKILEVVVDIACDQATSEEKTEFFKAVSTVLVDLCSQLQEVSNGIHGSITFDSPDLVDVKKSSHFEDQKGLLDGVVGTVVGAVTPVVGQVPVAGPLVISTVVPVIGTVESAIEPIVGVLPLDSEDQKGLLDGVVGTVIGTVAPVVGQVPVVGSSVLPTVVAPIANQVGAIDAVVDQIPLVGTIL